MGNCTAHCKWNWNWVWVWVWDWAQHTLLRVCGVPAANSFSIRNFYRALIKFSLLSSSSLSLFNSMEKKKTILDYKAIISRAFCCFWHFYRSLSFHTTLKSKEKGYENSLQAVKKKRRKIKTKTNAHTCIKMRHTHIEDHLLYWKK